jgi:hypothetical protein
LFEGPDNKRTVGRFQRMAVEVMDKELIVAFMIDRVRCEADLGYFIENLTIYNGDTQRTSSDYIRGLLKGDRAGSA